VKKYVPVSGPVDFGGFEIGLRNGLHALAHQKDGEGRKNARQYNCQVTFLYSENRGNDVVRHQHRLQGHEHYHDKAEKNLLLVLPLPKRKAVGRKEADTQSAKGNRQRDLYRVKKKDNEGRLVNQNPGVLLHAHWVRYE